ncbi:hypothetical protein L6452_15575 [Arctium lappa]|uniref:Uncharacterized protein n=1 Tax=Arctium lappa TaxID=4217 RepID=A0ACB9CNY8_ARCLA|nr:hypothetical protein L6452_15575 [Arctium lappa]
MKPTIDPLALVAEKKHRYSSRSSRYQKDAMVLLKKLASGSDYQLYQEKDDSGSDSQLHDLKHAMVLLTKDIQKKLYNLLLKTKALIAEDDHWLNLSDDDEELDAHAHWCFMARHNE